jgi:hypothetical protein
VVKIFQGDEQRVYFEKEFKSLNEVKRHVKHPGIVDLVDGKVICYGDECTAKRLRGGSHFSQQTSLKRVLKQRLNQDSRFRQGPSQKFKAYIVYEFCSKMDLFTYV